MVSRSVQPLTTRVGIGFLALFLGGCAPAAPQAAPTAAPPAAVAPAAAPTSVAPAQPAGKPVASDALAGLIEGARKESVLKAQWSSTGFGGGPGFEAFVADMNRKWGLNIKPQFTPGSDMQATLAKIAQEAAAGQPASSDVYLGNAPAALEAQKNRVLRPVDWNAILERPVPREEGFDPVAPDNIALAFGSTLVGVTYNSDLVKGADIPHKLQDLLNPKWKGKIASTPYAAGFREFAAPNILGREPVIDFVRRYSQQIGGLIRCGEADRLTSGEFLMLGLDCGGQDVETGKRKGQPIDQVILDDATLVHMRYAGVPVNSSSPNAATLFVVYLLSSDGQAALWKYDGQDLHLFPESHTKPLVDKIRSAGGKYGVNSPQWLSSIPDFSGTQKELEGILQQAGH